MGWVNRYTIGAGVALVVLIMVWLQFGGAISSWSAGVYQAVRGNREAVQKLQQSEQAAQQAQAEQQRVLQEYATTQAAVRNLSQQIVALQQQSNQAVAAARTKDVTITQLRDSIARLEKKRAEQAPVRSLQEAKDVLGQFNPAYH